MPINGGAGHLTPPPQTARKAARAGGDPAGSDTWLRALGHPSARVAARKRAVHSVGRCRSAEADQMSVEGRSMDFPDGMPFEAPAERAARPCPRSCGRRPTATARTGPTEDLNLGPLACELWNRPLRPYQLVSLSMRQAIGGQRILYDVAGAEPIPAYIPAY
jgi:hypothetical protein